MKICVLRAFPDTYRKSMAIYADQLVKAIRSMLPVQDQILECVPEAVRLQPLYARYWDQYVRYQWQTREIDADVNHVIDHGYGHLLYTLPAGRSVVTFHDSTVTKVAQVSWRTRLSLRYSLRAMRLAGAVIADSEVSRQDFLRLVDYPPDRVTVVYPGIDPAFRQRDDLEDARTRYQLPPRFVLHVGHTLPYMNLETVFRVISDLVHRRGLNTSLLKVGDQFTAAQETLIHELRLEGHVRHLRRVPLGDLSAIYGCADVVIYPVLYTGFGLPPLEAMACGTPVVASSRGSLPEILGGAALMADAEDRQGLADAVAALLTDAQLRERHRILGLAHARRFNWHEAASAVLQVYRRVNGA